MRLIGINGFRTSGKDTTFQIVGTLKPELSVQRAAFADKLKTMAGLALGYEGSTEALVELMDELKEHGYIRTNFNVLGGNELDDTILTDPSRMKIISGRQYLQLFGAKARELFGDTFWVDQVLPPPAFKGGDSFANQNNLQARYPDADILCVTDVRYPNEAERVLDLGGEVWEIIRPGIESDGHSSEQPLPRELVTRSILNDGSIDDLTVKVSAALLKEDA